MSEDLVAVVRGEKPWHVEQADCLAVMRSLPDRCIQACCTSPPFFGLRRYEGVEPTAWPEVSYSPMPGLPPLTVPAMEACLGNEPTPDAFIAHLLLVLRELWRVLRDDGCVFWNLGDSYGNGASGGSKGGQGNTSWRRGRSNVESQARSPGASKQLIGIPWRFAFAAQADGWYLRQVINWQKTSPMPASAKDRPTSATEEIFLLTKRPRYFYDIDACRVPSSPVTLERDRYTHITDTATEEQYAAKHDHETPSNPAGRNLWNWWDIAEDDADDNAAKLAWRLGPEPSGEKHYAAYPSEIPRRAWLLGTSRHGCCPACWAPWRRVVQHKGAPRNGYHNEERERAVHAGGGKHKGICDGAALTAWREQNPIQTIGWEPTCKCNRADVIPCLCFDPFTGTGTSGVAARGLGRRFVGAELSPIHAGTARRRIGWAAPLDDAIVAARAQVIQPTLFGDDT